MEKIKNSDITKVLDTEYSHNFSEEIVNKMRNSLLEKTFEFGIFNLPHIQAKLGFKETVKQDKPSLKEIKENLNFDFYDVICLDVDHTLAIYRNDNLSELIFEAFAKYLHLHRGFPDLLNKAYPVFKNFFDIKNKFYSLDIVIDKKQGCVLKLNHDKSIAMCYVGLEQLSNTRVEELYKNSRFEVFNNNIKNCDDYIWISGWYEYCKISLFIFYSEIVKILEIIRDNNIDISRIDMSEQNHNKKNRKDLEYLVDFINKYHLSNNKDKDIEDINYKETLVDLSYLQFRKTIIINKAPESDLPSDIEKLNMISEEIETNLPSYGDILNNLYLALVFNFFHFDLKTNQQFPCASAGYFFPPLFKNPENYLCAKFNSLRFLQNLKKKGKHIVLITNSAYEFSDLVLRNTAGEDYLDYCDVMIYFSKKPVFFNKLIENKDNSCINTNINKWNFLDTNVNNHTGDVIKFEKENNKVINSETNNLLLERINKQKQTIFGNYQDLEDFFKLKLNRDDVKFLMVGDSIFSDCFAANKLTNWQTVYILSSLENKEFNRINIPRYFGEYWGKYFNFCEEIRHLNEEDQKERISLNISLGLLKESGVIIIPHVEYIDYFSS